MSETIQSYDVILVLGSQPDPITWEFPKHVYDSLDKAIELFYQGLAPYIALSGNYTIKFDHIGLTQPYKEADKMEEYVLSKGVPAQKVLKENISRDTVANFYYVKNLILKPRSMHKVLLVTADFRAERIKFLWQKVVGPDYPLDVITVPFGSKDTYENDARILKRQQEWLKDVNDGNDPWFKDKFYTDPYYLEAKAKDKAQLVAETDPTKRT